MNTVSRVPLETGKFAKVDRHGLGIVSICSEVKGWPQGMKSKPTGAVRPGDSGRKVVSRENYLEAPESKKRLKCAARDP